MFRRHHMEKLGDFLNRTEKTQTVGKKKFYQYIKLNTNVTL